MLTQEADLYAILLPLLLLLLLLLHSWRPGGASLLWAAAALQSLSADLKSRYGAGAAIVFRQGPYAAALQEVSD
jgi:hypothetical protein